MIGDDGDMSSDSEIFSAEFRHEQVQKFIIGLLNGSLRPFTPVPMPEGALKDRAELLVNIAAYVSGTLRGEELSKTEERIFNDFAIMRATGTIQEVNPSSSQIENEIAKLHSRIDNTNALLKQVLTVLNELVKKFDK